jgi:hypothetical protein
VGELLSVRGKRHAVPAVAVGPHATVILQGRVIRIASIHDEFWLDPEELPSPDAAIAALKASKMKADLFTFAQPLGDGARSYDHYRDWDNVAVATFDSYDDWFAKVNRSVRKHVKKSVREGVSVEVVPFSDELVHGICGIYNSTAVRQGRHFWHYGKEFDTVKRENGTYLPRSRFMVATYGTEVIGFVKLVIKRKVASIMQIVSKTEYAERRPTNALLSKAVDVCASEGVHALTYGQYVYGNKDESSLIDFKRNNGFTRVDVPRYYIPLTIVGRLALATRTHQTWTNLVPDALLSRARAIRSKVYNGRQPPPASRADAEERVDA